MLRLRCDQRPRSGSGPERRRAAESRAASPGRRSSAPSRRRAGDRHDRNGIAALAHLRTWSTGIRRPKWVATSSGSRNRTSTNWCRRTSGGCAATIVTSWSTPGSVSSPCGRRFRACSSAIRWSCSPTRIWIMSVGHLSSVTGPPTPPRRGYGALIDNLPNSDVAAYRRSMEFLADLDVSVVHPGHGHSFDRTRLRQLAETYLRRKA